MATVQSECGKIKLFNDFCGPEIPVANAVAYGTTAGGCNYYLGDYAVRGMLGETDSGAVAMGVPSGVIRLTGTDQSTKGCALTTDLQFKPSVNGTIVVEARVQSQVLTARRVFVGFCGTLADDVLSPLTGATTTLTLTASHLCGLFWDSALTAAGYWHAVYNGGETTGVTTSTLVTTGVLVVAAKYNVCRVEIDRNGTARYYIDGVLKKTVKTAVSTTTLQAAIVGVWATTTTVTDLDVDYMLVTAARDWTV